MIIFLSSLSRKKVMIAKKIDEASPCSEDFSKTKTINPLKKYFQVCWAKL